MPQTIITSGTSTWQVPAGITTLTKVVIIGGGGCGEAAGGGFGGGGGGCRVLTDYAVTPLANLNYSVGAGGANGANGGTTTFNGNSATGGVAGNQTPGAGGTGTYTGGAGGSWGGGYGGGGGGAAGETGNGTAGVSGNGVVGGAGGAGNAPGGAGGAAGDPPSNGVNYGGGGGGSQGMTVGGSGAGGYIEINWTEPVTDATVTAANLIVSGATLSATVHTRQITAHLTTGGAQISATVSGGTVADSPARAKPNGVSVPMAALTNMITQRRIRKMSQSNFYWVQIPSTNVSASLDILQLIPTTGVTLRVVTLILGQVNVSPPTADEKLIVSWRRGYTTAGSGGTATTIRPCKPNSAGTNTLCTVFNTTVASAGAAADTGPRHIFEAKVGFERPYTQDESFESEGILVLRLEVAPLITYMLTGSVLIEEVIR